VQLTIMKYVSQETEKNASIVRC